MSLSAVGIKSNIEGIGSKSWASCCRTRQGRRRRIPTRTNRSGRVYAIGDIVPGPALAHVASAEAVCRVESICLFLGSRAGGLSTTIPSHLHPARVVPVGMTEQQALVSAASLYKAGCFPFTASGKATAAGRPRRIRQTALRRRGSPLGAHMVGALVTEMCWLSRRWRVRWASRPTGSPARSTPIRR